MSRGESIASESLIRKIKKLGIRKLLKFGCKRRVLEKMCRREPVAKATLHEYERMVRQRRLALSSKPDHDG